MYLQRSARRLSEGFVDFFFLGNAPVSRKKIHEIKFPLLFRFARERVENVTRVQAAEILSV